jgi:hypothetical protein
MAETHLRLVQPDHATDATDRADLRHEAHLALAAGDKVRARSILDMLDAMQDDHPLLPFLHADCLEQEGETSRAITMLRHAVSNARALGIMSLVNSAEAHLAKLMMS